MVPMGVHRVTALDTPRQRYALPLQARFEKPVRGTHVPTEIIALAPLHEVG